MHTETRDQVLLLRGFTRLTSENATLFRELVQATLTPEHLVLAVDLAQVTMLDSVGIGALISAQKQLAQRRGVVRLLRPQPFVDDTIRLLKLDRIFEVVPALEA